MDTDRRQELTSAELSGLWNCTMFVSLVHHMYAYFLRHVEDPDIKKYVAFNHSESGVHLHEFETALQDADIPVPRGIRSDDIHPDAPRLYSDAFYASYVKGMVKFALTTYSICLTEASCDSLRKLYHKKIDDLQTLDQKGTELLIAKGLYVHAPYVPAPKTIDFVKKQSFLAGFFGRKRALTVMEVNQLFNHVQSNSLGKALLMGFSQVMQSKELRDYMIRGKNLSAKYVNELSDRLSDEDLPLPPTYDGEVTESTESPFSEKLMLYHTTVLGSSGLGNYGMSLAVCQRRDLSAMFARIMLEVGTFVEDGANLLIERDWLEQPPMAVNRAELVDAPG